MMSPTVLPDISLPDISSPDLAPKRPHPPSRAGRRERAQAAARLYTAVVEASRREVFYRTGGVPDTVDGRFELLALHLGLLLRRLMGGEAALAQALFDHAFAQLDLNLREMGVGDTGVGKRIRHMAESLYGRMGAYDVGRTADVPDALRRNLFGTVTPAPGAEVIQPFVAYLHQVTESLETQTEEDLRQGRVVFPPFYSAEERQER